GGPAILCADACEANGLVVPALPPEVRDVLSGFLPPAASTGNPVDMIASASADDYSRAIAALAACPEVDAIIVIFTPPLVTKAPEVIDAIQRGARDLPRAIPLLSVFMSTQSAPHVVRTDGVAVPHYPFPEEAAHALSLAARYGAWRALPDEAAPVLDRIDRDRAMAVIARALAEGGGWMAPRALGE